jgi:vancomycin aglycone glucosyltransferase
MADQDDCFVIGEVNQQKLFDRVAAVVHHGGAGTTTRQSASARRRWWCPKGRPDLLGRSGDRPRHRRCSRRSDADRRIPVSRAQDRSDAPATRARAAALAAGIRTDGAPIAAKLVLVRDAADRL